MDFRIRFTGLLMIMCATILHSQYFLQLVDADPRTDPHEIDVLKTILKKLGKKDWNFKADPCTHWNCTADPKRVYENNVTCNCSHGNYCHVTHILLKRQSLAGVVPGELADLKYLEEIDLFRNYLNGSIPAVLGSLTHLKNLSLGVNRLSGEIPKELANLKNLTSLVLISNNLFGRLPLELGKLEKLERLHISSNQFSGEIPATFVNLKNLQDFRASGNDFRGKIPDLIGSWTNLETLVLEGTSLEGPIPSTLSRLTKLTELRITDITQGGSSLNFLRSLTKMKTLVLRNSLISGKIPKWIGEWKELKTLDLSFNNLIGTIPFSVAKSKFMYFRNNSLMGEMPSRKEINYALDLSYNNFTKVPNWYTPEEEIYVNLIGNFLNMSSIGGSKIACLQRSSYCKEAKYTFLAINCGGMPLDNSALNISFEGDVNPLGPSQLYVSGAGNWAVSNTGHFLHNETYTAYRATLGNSQSIHRKHAIDPELYRTARLSPASLRYYGLRLHNLPYTVELHFAEIIFSDTESFASLGVRIFDVYIQGIRVLKDFNIAEEAGGPYKVVVKTFHGINVTKNTLEIHFFWAGKGTPNVPYDGTYGPLVSAIIVKSDSNVTNKSSQTPKVVGIVFGVVISLSTVLYLSFIIIKRRKGRDGKLYGAHQDRELLKIDANSNLFSLTNLKIATRDFDSENKIGEGGFGDVYKGILPDGKMVAVKQMSSKSRQGNREFLNEVSTISAVQHPNLVKLYGCCIEGKQLLLVYEYVENNSLARALFGPDEYKLKLDWPMRYDICLGVARGLAYLHEESRIRIVHRDIKSTNILLDQNLNPKIADFGLAKLYEGEKTHISTQVAGTVGYMAPEYALRGHLTEKADVYSFGMVVLEVVSGRTHTEKKLQGENFYLLEWAWNLYEEKRLLDLVDKNLHSNYSGEEVLRMINVGLLCTSANPTLRPSMTTVVDMVEGKILVDAPNARPGYLHWQTRFRAEGPSPLSPSLSSSSSHTGSTAKKSRKEADSDENSLLTISGSEITTE